MTKTNTDTKCLKDSMYTIFSKNRGLKDVKIDEDITIDPKSAHSAREPQQKLDFPPKKLVPNEKNVKFALPCRTNIVISPKLWPVIA